MATIIDYVAQETRDFSEYPFHVADALVYAILSYDKIPQEVPQLSSLLECFGSISSKLRNFNLKHPSRSLAALWRTPFPGPTLREVEERLHEYELTHPYWEHHSGFSDDDETPHRFYRSIKRNPRFAVTRMSAAEERFDISQQTQYAAETFQLPDGTLLVAFRGTDDSFTGWREDFNMAFTYPVPAQKQAADYLEKVGRLWPNARIMLTGHSKGGNIAIYAAMNARDQIKDRIERIYAFDSPGFNQDVVSSYEYGTIVDRITKLVPEFSIIGMLLQSSPREHMIVVKSNADGLMQHSCYTWLMDGDRFDTVPALSESSRDFRGALNTWLNGMTQRQREHGVEALFRVLSSGGHSTITQLRTDGMKALPGLFSSYVGLDSEDRHYINQAIMLLAGTRFTH